MNIILKNNHKINEYFFNMKATDCVMEVNVRKRIDGHVHLIGRHETDWIDPLTGYRHGAYGMLHTPMGSRRRTPVYMADSSFTADTLAQVMDEYGVEKAVLMARLESGIGDLAVDAMQRFPGRMTAAVSVEIREQGLEELEYWNKRGIRIVKFEMRGLNEFYGKLDVDSDMMRKLFRKTEELGMIAVVDPGPVSFPSYRPEGIRHILELCPGLRLVICHLGLPYEGLKDQPEQYRKWQEMIGLGKCGRVWFDVTAMPDLFGKEGFPYSGAMEYLKEAADNVGISKLIWGTDMPGTFRHATYPQMIEMFERCSFLSEKDKDRLFYQNADELYFGRQI